MNPSENDMLVRVLESVGDVQKSVIGVDAKVSGVIDRLDRQDVDNREKQRTVDDRLLQLDAKSDQVAVLTIKLEHAEKAIEAGSKKTEEQGKSITGLMIKVGIGVGTVSAGGAAAVSALF